MVTDRATAPLTTGPARLARASRQMPQAPQTVPRRAATARPGVASAGGVAVWPPWTYWVRTTLAVVAHAARGRRRAADLPRAAPRAGRVRAGRRFGSSGPVARPAADPPGLGGGHHLRRAGPVRGPVRGVADSGDGPGGAAVRWSAAGYVADLQRRDDWLGGAFRHANVSVEVRQFIADLPRKIGHSFTAIVGAAGTAFGRVFDVFTVGILCIYFMVALPRLPG